MTDREFPVLRDYLDRRRYPDARRSVPWSWVAPFEPQVARNHEQSLERLAERGGLSPAELYCAVAGLSLRCIDRRTVTEDEAEAWLATWDGTPL
jgi:hypothetical protein